MKIGIVDRIHSNSRYWISYCKENQIPYKLVDPYATNIFEQLRDCSAFMWHINHGDYRDMIFGKALIISLSKRGIRTYPDINSVWHFDDKIAESYLLKAINAPVADYWCFYTKKTALDWLKTAEFPIVFKIRCGASASNVWLLDNQKKAKRYIKKAFSQGFAHSNPARLAFENFTRWISGKTKFRNFAKFIALWIFPKTFNVHLSNREKGYVYFQKFYRNNDCDYRIVVSGNNAYAMKRMVRKNDFRASGGGLIRYEKDQIPDCIVKTAFDTSRKLKAHTIAYDFVLDEAKQPRIIEICYSNGKPEGDCNVGYWTSDMKFHEGPFNPFKWMVESVIDDEK